MKHAKTPRSLGKVSLQTSRKSAPISAFILAGALALSACEQAPSDLMGAAKEAMAAGQQRDAMLHLSAAVSAEPDNNEARFLLGKVSLNQGNLDRAATELERIGAETEFYAPAQILLAETYQLQGNMRRARQTIDALPLETPEAYKVAVTFALSDGQIDQAMGQIDEGLARFPDASELIALDAQRLWRGGNPVAAAERLETALTDPEASFEVHLLAGQIALSERAQDKAKGHFSKVLEMRPSQQAAMLGLAAIARDAGDDQTAKEWLAKASASDRAHPMAVYFAAQMAYDGGDLDQAYNLVQAMPPELSSVPQVARLEGFIASARGNSQNAISAFERYLARGEGD
jgi:tetratricopeptide (TPR) repeat protein